MAMGRPDPDSVRRQAAIIFEGAGETAQLRRFISAAGGVPQYGIEPNESFTTRAITGLFRAPSPAERAAPGGYAYDADLLLTMDSALAPRDEINWQGVRYIVAGSAMPMRLGG